MNVFSLRAGIRQGYLLSLSRQYCVGHFREYDQAWKRNIWIHPDWKRRNKSVFICRWHVHITGVSKLQSKSMYNLLFKFFPCCFFMLLFVLVNKISLEHSYTHSLTYGCFALKWQSWATVTEILWKKNKHKKRCSTSSATTEMQTKTVRYLEHLTGSVGWTCDSWSRGAEFEPHTGCRDYF